MDKNLQPGSIHSEDSFVLGFGVGWWEVLSQHVSAFPWGQLGIPGVWPTPEVCRFIIHLPHPLSKPRIDSSAGRVPVAARTSNPCWVSGALLGFTGREGTRKLLNAFSGTGTLLGIFHVSVTMSPCPCSPMKKCLGFCDSILQIMKLRLRKVVQLAPRLELGMAESRKGTQILPGSVSTFLSLPQGPPFSAPLKRLWLPPTSEQR